MDKKVVPIVAVLVERDGKFYMVKQGANKDEGLYGFPGGAVDPGESPIQAAKRELQEEIGININLEGLIGIYSMPTRQGNWAIVFALKGTYIEDIPRKEIEGEIAEVVLRMPQEILDMPDSQHRFTQSKDYVRNYIVDGVYPLDLIKTVL